MRRCDQCQFFFAYPPAESPDRISFSGDQIRGGGECRCNPPVATEELQPIGSFPVVFYDYWCGRFDSNQPQQSTSQLNPLIKTDIARAPTKPHQKQNLAQ
jgi:hypothetical protein